MARKGAREGRGGGKAGAECHLGQRMPRVGDQATGGGKAQLKGISAGGLAEVLAEQGFKTAGGEVEGGGGFCGGFGRV